MSAPYTPIVATLGYVVSPDRKQTLLIHRITRPQDPHLGKYNGLGGKMDPGEDVATCMKREIHEESGLTVLSMTLRGTVSWPGFGPQGEDWLGFIFRIDQTTGTPHKITDEGHLDWHPIDRLHELPMWEGDPYFLPLVFDDDPRPFHGHMPYAQGRPLSWSYERL